MKKEYKRHARKYYRQRQTYDTRKLLLLRPDNAREKLKALQKVGGECGMWWVV
jgi:hypothetical protein